MSEIKLPIQLRTALAEDVGFIFNSWLKSYRSSDVVKPIMNEVFFAEQHRLIEHLITQHKVIIACNADNPDQVYGFICAGATEGIFTVHYIYVKQAFRRMGIAKMLLDNKPEPNSNNLRWIQKICLNKL